LVAFVKNYIQKNYKIAVQFLKIDVWQQQQNFSKKFFKDVDEQGEHNTYNYHCGDGKIKTRIIFFNAYVTR
jgi:hypothetical protein